MFSSASTIDKRHWSGALPADRLTMGFWMEVLLGGLMAGVLYSLVALGFVLIFKASGVFNFAQGAMVLFAALAVARLAENMPLWLAIVLAPRVRVGRGGGGRARGGG